MLFHHSYLNFPFHTKTLAKRAEGKTQGKGKNERKAIPIRRVIGATTNAGRVEVHMYVRTSESTYLFPIKWSKL